MGTLQKIGNIYIRVYTDHPPPHFHVVAPDFEALIEIATSTVLRGALPTRHRDTVMDWVEANLAAIIAEWNRMNPRFPI